MFPQRLLVGFLSLLVATGIVSLIIFLMQAILAAINHGILVSG